MFVTDEGMAIEVRDEHNANALSPMLVIPAVIVTCPFASG